MASFEPIFNRPRNNADVVGVSAAPIIEQWFRAFGRAGEVFWKQAGHANAMGYVPLWIGPRPAAAFGFVNFGPRRFNTVTETQGSQTEAIAGTVSSDDGAIDETHGPQTEGIIGVVA